MIVQTNFVRSYVFLLGHMIGVGLMNNPVYRIKEIGDLRWEKSGNFAKKMTKDDFKMFRSLRFLMKLEESY